MSLEKWLANGFVVQHQTSPQEIADLRSVVERDLKDASTKGLSADWRLAIAYNAALQCALMALAAAGYRPSRQGHHYYAIESLTLTVGLSEEDVRILDMFRKKRNIADYERANVASEAEVKELLQLVKKLHKQVLDWLKSHYPQLHFTKRR